MTTPSPNQAVPSDHGAPNRTATVDAYLDAYGDPDDVRRLAKVGELFAEEAEVTDPPFTAVGRDEISGAFGAVLAQFPGHRFERVGEPDAHHDAVRSSWRMVGPDGAEALRGTDFLLFDSEHLIVRVVGFFDIS